MIRYLRTGREGGDRSYSNNEEIHGTNMYSEGRQCAYTVDAATMRKQGKNRQKKKKKACSVADPDPFGPELICQIRIQINN